MKLKNLLKAIKGEELQYIQLLDAKDKSFLLCETRKDLLTMDQFKKYLESEVCDLYSDDEENEITIEVVCEDDKTYQLVFCSGRYSHVDYEGDYESCCEVKYELESQMYVSGERDFYYIIEEKEDQ